MLKSSQPSILIIDDDHAILRVFTKIFQRRGYTVEVASEGREAIKKICSSQFDVALIDFCLPDMEGTQLFPLIQHTSPRTLKIMLTGKAEALNSLKGADALIGKPIQPDQLLSLIDSKLKNQNIENIL
ncbi:MAG: response regulator [Candidatus Bathyarchaeota archaeon]|nr:response regulator [Candidatus Bathyarchaeota archaeon]